MSTKYINYSDGEICSLKGKSSIVACGYQSSNKYSICQVDVGFDRADNSVSEFFEFIKFYKNKREKLFINLQIACFLVLLVLYLK